jgi:hypothetical protein
LIVGALLVAGGFSLLARESGSYQGAGAVVDQKVQQTEQSAKDAAENAGDAAKDAGQRIENATDTSPDGK